MPWGSVQTWWWYKAMKVTISFSLSRKRVTVSQHQWDRVSQGAELRWYQITSTLAARTELGPWTFQSSCSRMAIVCFPSLLPGHVLSPSSPSPGWHWLEFHQQCIWEMEKSDEVSWLQTRPYLIFCRLQLIPRSSNGWLLCRGEKAKSCQGGVIWKASVVVCNIFSFHFPSPHL